MSRLLALALLVPLLAHAQMFPPRGGGAGGTGPAPNAAAAAKQTAEQNPICTAVSPFYVQINTISGGLVWFDSVNTTQPTWSGSTTYGVGARVMYGSATTPYLSLQASNLNQNPSTATTYWQLLVANNSATGMAVASASKLQYGVFFTLKKGGYSAFSTADQQALNFTDPYANMGSETKTQQCALTGVTYCGTSTGVNSVNNCLQICGTVNTSQSGTYQNNTVGQYNYDSAHIQNHASANQSLEGIANLATGSIYPQYVSAFGAGGGTFGSPLLAGGIQQNPSNYMLFLTALMGSSTARSILPDNPSVLTNSIVTAYCIGSLGAVGPNACPLNGGSTGLNPNVWYSPITSKWKYGLTYWWETDTSQNNDFSVSSPGAYGFYPFITPTCPAAGHAGNICTTQAEFVAAGANPWSYYGVVAQSVPSGSSPTGNGQASGACGALIRYAYMTATPLLTQTIPP
jgi:hypothetical protein